MLQQNSILFSETARRALAAALGPAPAGRRGLLAATRVETPEGWRPLAEIGPGDRLCGQDARPRTVLRMDRIVLEGRPAQDCLRQAALLPDGILGNSGSMVLLPDQELLLHVPRARELLGADFALLAGRALRGASNIRPAEGAERVEILTPVFGEAAAIWVGAGLMAICPGMAESGAVMPAPQVPVLDARRAQALIGFLARPAASFGPSPFRAPKVSTPRRVKPTGCGKRRHAAEA